MAMPDVCFRVGELVYRERTSGIEEKFLNGG